MYPVIIITESLNYKMLLHNKTSEHAGDFQLLTFCVALKQDFYLGNTIIWSTRLDDSLNRTVKSLNFRKLKSKQGPRFISDYFLTGELTSINCNATYYIHLYEDLRKYWALQLHVSKEKKTNKTKLQKSTKIVSEHF